MANSTQLITGYTGERHITPNMDAIINNSIWGNPEKALGVQHNNQ